MIPAAILSLPDSFVAGVVLVVVSVIAAFSWARKKDRNRPASGYYPLFLFAAAVVCMAYASFTIVPSGKVVSLSDAHGVAYEGVPLKEGFHFKNPWENTQEYDDVISDNYATSPEELGEESLFAPNVSFLYSNKEKARVGSSYLLAYTCGMTLNKLVKAGQTSLEEFTCTFGDKSFLVVREIEQE